MSDNIVTLFAVGDIILKNEDPESYFDLVAPTLKSGDIVIGQGEIPYTNRPARTTETMSAEDPESMKGLTYAGFNVITLTGNHMWDAGVPGIEDTLRLAERTQYCSCRHRNEHRRSAPTGDRRKEEYKSRYTQLQLRRPQGDLGKSHKTRVRLCQCSHSL